MSIPLNASLRRKKGTVITLSCLDLPRDSSPLISDALDVSSAVDVLSDRPSFYLPDFGVGPDAMLVTDATMDWSESGDLPQLSVHPAASSSSSRGDNNHADLSDWIDEFLMPPSVDRAADDVNMLQPALSPMTTLCFDVGEFDPSANGVVSMNQFDSLLYVSTSK